MRLAAGEESASFFIITKKGAKIFGLLCIGSLKPKTLFSIMFVFFVDLFLLFLVVSLCNVELS